jgi:hypothetical protein
VKDVVDKAARMDRNPVKGLINLWATGPDKTLKSIIYSPGEAPM